MAIHNAMLEQVRNGEPSYGAWISTMSARSAEAFGANGLDWATIDMEHSPIGAAGVENVIRGVERHGMTPLVRVPEIDYGLRGTFKRVLDSGAQGVIVPRVESREQAERVVEAAMYPGEGARGVVGSSRANYYGTKFDEYVGAANDELFVCVQLETATGADHASEILAVDGINGVFVGENDLSTTHGVPGEKGREAVQRDVDRILAAAKNNDVVAGTVAATTQQIDQRLDDGFDLISIGSDIYFIGRSIGQLLPD